MTDLPLLKLQALVTFPAQILDGTGIDVAKINGAYRFDLAFDDFAPPVAGIPDATHQQVLLWNSVTGAYILAPVSIVGAGGAVGEAPNDGVQYGRQSLNWTPVVSGGTPSSSIPLIESGTGNAGVATTYARGDHVHPASAGTGQPLDADLTAIAALTGTGVARRTGTNTWTVGDPVANADLATMAAYTFKGNNTNAPATPGDVDIAALTTKVSPAGGDFLLLSDQAASGTWKKIAISTLPGASGGITEAPNDAFTYGRHALGWVAISGTVTPADLTRVNDTNVTLTLGGTPVGSLLQNVSITAGWTGRLAYSRFTQGGALSVLGVSGNATADHASIASAADGAVLRQSGVTLSFGTLSTLSYADASVTYAKIQNVSATSRLLGRVSAGAGPVEELTGAQGAALVSPTILATDNTWTGIQGYNESALTYTSGGTTAWDVDANPVATVAMATGNTTMGAPTNVVAGRVYTIRFTQDTSPRTVAWTAANYKFNGGTPAGLPVISVGSGAIDRLTFIGRTGNVLEEIGRSQGIA